MKLMISDAVAEQFPDVKLGVIVAKGIDNSTKSDELSAALAQVVLDVRAKMGDKVLSDLPKIKDWREAYSAFGGKPKKYKCSVEALLKRVQAGEDLPCINSLVDCYNIVSIRHLLPVGGDDLDHVSGDIVLGIADGTEEFIQLGSSEVDHPKEGEVVYKDDTGVLCRRWNWREGERTKMSESTVNSTLVLEGLKSTSREDIEIAAAELKMLVEKYCGGSLDVFYLDKDCREVEIKKE